MKADFSPHLENLLENPILQAININISSPFFHQIIPTWILLY